MIVLSLPKPAPGNSTTLFTLLVILMADQLSSQFLIFLVGQKELTHSWDRTINFFVQSRLTNFQKKDWTKNSTKTIVRSPGWDNFHLADQKNEKLTRQLVGQRDWPKQHGLPYNEWNYRVNFGQLPVVDINENILSNVIALMKNLLMANEKMSLEL